MTFQVKLTVKTKDPQIIEELTDFYNSIQSGEFQRELKKGNCQVTATARIC